MHVGIEDLKGKENLQFRNRGGNDYPFEIFTVIEGVRIFALAEPKDLKEFLQFKGHAKAELLKQIEELEKLS